MKKIKLLFLFVFLFLPALLFAILLKTENDEKIPVKFLHLIDGEYTVFWLIIIPFVAGLLVGALLMGFSVLKQKRRFSIEHKKLSKVEKEVENLRALPLKDEV